MSTDDPTYDLLDAALDGGDAPGVHALWWVLDVKERQVWLDRHPDRLDDLRTALRLGRRAVGRPDDARLGPPS